MNKCLYRCLVSCCVVTGFTTGVFAESFNGTINEYNLSYDMTLENYGTINKIYTNDYNLTIYNYGNVGIVDNLSGIGYVHQYVPDNTALHKINLVGSNFLVDIANLDKVSLTDLKEVVDGATKVVIDNSSVVINDFADWRNWNQNVSLVNTNVLYIAHPETVISGERLNFVKDNSTKVVLLDSERLYKVNLKHDSGASFIYVTKEADASKLFDDERSDVLKEMQFSGGVNGNFMTALNNATNMQEVQRIMQLSYRFNPSILMRPIYTLNQFSLNYLLFDENPLYGGLSGFYLVSDTTNSFGMHFDVVGKYEDLYLGATINANKFQYENEFNDFDGLSYGANIKLKKYIGDIWTHGTAGISFANFKTDTIYYDNMIKSNPFGYSGYGAIDIGYDYDALSGLRISPFAGVVAQTSNVAHCTDTDVTLRAGGNIRYYVVTDDIKYEYSGVIGGMLNGDLFGKVKIGFLSTQDNAGISFDLDVLKNENDIHYKFTLNGKLSF